MVIDGTLLSGRNVDGAGLTSSGSHIGGNNRVGIRCYLDAVHTRPICNRAAETTPLFLSHIPPSFRIQKGFFPLIRHWLFKRIKATQKLICIDLSGVMIAVLYEVSWKINIRSIGLLFCRKEQFKGGKDSYIIYHLSYINVILIIMRKKESLIMVFFQSNIRS